MTHSFLIQPVYASAVRHRTLCLGGAARLGAAAYYMTLVPLPREIKRNIARLLVTSEQPFVARWALLLAQGVALIVFAQGIVSSRRYSHASRKSHREELALLYAQRDVLVGGVAVLLSLCVRQQCRLLLRLDSSDKRLIAMRMQRERDAQSHRQNEQQLSERNGQVETLQAALDEAKKQHIDTSVLLKQAAQQSEEYMRLADRYNALERHLTKSFEPKKDI